MSANTLDRLVIGAFAGMILTMFLMAVVTMIGIGMLFIPELRISIEIALGISWVSDSIRICSLGFLVSCVIMMTSVIQSRGTTT